ncbi:Acyl-CoA N-acyltransferase [Cordyceps javanica]|nr:Acyl-CoA N-acyltransferase [Cordyceps javanica]
MTAQSAAQATGRLSFQTATLSHVAALRALVVSAFRGPSSREGWTTEADLFTDERISEAGLVAKIQRPASKVVMVLDDQSGTLLGCAEIVGGGQGPVAQIGMVAVAPRSQGRGIGKALMAHLEQIGRAEYQAESMELYVIWTRNELIDFYIRRGFSRTKRTKPFPYGELVNGKALRDDLYFVVLEKTFPKTLPN